MRITERRILSAMAFLCRVCQSVAYAVPACMCCWLLRANAHKRHLTPCFAAGRSVELLEACFPEPVKCMGLHPKLPQAVLVTRAVCPIGGMNGLFAKLSMTELRARQGVCGGAYWHHAIQIGCSHVILLLRGIGASAADAEKCPQGGACDVDVRLRVTVAASACSFSRE